MILAGLGDLIQKPFGYLLDWLYQLTTNYGVALILFAVLVKLILYPATAKAKKSTMKMSRLQPQIQAIQRKYADDKVKQNAAVQQLYKDSGVSMGGGCLWSLLPLLILIPLYTVVRNPIVYMLHETGDAANKIIETIKTAAPDLFSGNNYYHQMIAAHNIPNFVQELKEAIPNISETTLRGIDFSFIGLDLGSIPSFNVFKWSAYDWQHIGGFLLPVLSAGCQVVSMQVAKKMNNSLVTNEKGIYDEETAKNSQANQSGKFMTYLMPLMSLWLGFSVPLALSLYWLIQGVVTLAMDIYLTKKYRKIYDAEDAERLKKHLEEEALEAEKERQRAERRAANPDGITENTSKKKLQQKQQREQEAAKAAARKKYEAERGIAAEEEKKEKTPLSGIADRPFAKGRAYDPNRYASEKTEE
ncbi:MAG: YidC/Oxa1 family membrane protein insertase [Oscillospiraceae bacterium]|nr:YidC/Oxa1 family membrane protein insertase [Oscillospiraceae bacterium]